MRAQDYNDKKKRIKILRQKAAERNPDEFHFGMMSSGTHKGGQQIADRGNKVLSVDVVKLLKTQDTGYLRLMTQKTRRAKEKLELEFMLGEVKAGKNDIHVMKKGSCIKDPQHVIFVDDIDEQRAYDPITKRKSSNKYTNDSLPASLNDPTKEQRREDEETDEKNLKPPVEARQKSKKSVEDQKSAANAARALWKRRKRWQEGRMQRLQSLKDREKSLVIAEQELVAQRARMNNSSGGITKAGLKFKIRERKK